MSKANGTGSDPILAELTAIKRLLAFALQRNGCSQDDLGKALGMDQSSVSRMFKNGSSAKKSAKQKAKAGGRR